MNKALKYALCIVISVLITCTVIFLPYFYYSLDDNTGKNVIEETFSLESTKKNIKVRDFVNLITNKETSPVWLKGGAPSDYSKIEKTLKSALQMMSIYFENNEYASNALSNLFASIDTTAPCEIDAASANGKLNGIPTTCSLLYVKYYSADYDSDYISIIIDQKTNIIYELHYVTASNSLVNYNENDVVTELFYDDKVRDLTIKNLKAYWEIEDYDIYSLITSKNEFSFSLLSEISDDYIFSMSDYYDHKIDYEEFTPDTLQ